MQAEEWGWEQKSWLVHNTSGYNELSITAWTQASTGWGRLPSHHWLDLNECFYKMLYKSVKYKRKPDKCGEKCDSVISLLILSVSVWCLVCCPTSPPVVWMFCTTTVILIMVDDVNTDLPCACRLFCAGPAWLLLVMYEWICNWWICDKIMF